MSDIPVSLGVCFSDRQLYYAVSSNEETQALARIGKIDFNFDLLSCILGNDQDAFQAIVDNIDRIVKKYEVTNFRCLVPSFLETWSALPKSVYDQSSEREAYLRILKHGENRQHLEAYWFDMSNRDFRFLTVRNRIQSDRFAQLGDICSSTELCTEFEIGTKWMGITGSTDSFKAIGCYNDYISVSSYVMGKLRAATFIRYRYIEDLSYLWLQQASNLGWMNGVHDMVCYYGTNVYKVNEVLQHVTDGDSRQLRFDSLANMQVNAPEETYGFNLEEAFPAIILAH
ncbi:MAG: hypothetical protein JJU41_04520 [Bacteroidetes bacterium]|nr:hypothetical protein [Bacteroidota bacterium]MCH8523943.1 hypothetical protein [Balneolales bacterium]